MIPTPDRSDPEPVRGSLAQARAELERGDVREALRHLRRAAEGADEAGSELRAVALARAAADLATELGASVLPPPVKEVPHPGPLSMVVRGPDDTRAVIEQLLASGRAVKVAVKRSARDEGLYVVRRGDDAERLLGTREAVIVLLEPDDGFF